MVTQNNQVFSDIKLMVEQANIIMLAAHKKADGDAVGSLLGLGLCLIAAGKQVLMVLPDGVPSSYRFLDGYKLITRPIDTQADLFITLDCADRGRLGPQLETRTVNINIDHHATNDLFANVNLVLPEVPATAMIVAIMLFDWGYPLPQAVLDALLTGIVADTLGFRTSNMSAETLFIAGKLFEKGGRLTELYENALHTRSFEAVKFWGRGLQKISRQDGIVWTNLTIEDRSSASYTGNDDADLINVLSSIEDAQVAIIFIEQKNGNTKVSWRAKKGLDISKLAVKFGGGGHPGASGAEISGSLSEIESLIIEATKIYIQQVDAVEEN